MINKKVYFCSLKPASVMPTPTTLNELSLLGKSTKDCLASMLDKLPQASTLHKNNSVYDIFI